MDQPVNSNSFPWGWPVIAPGPSWSVPRISLPSCLGPLLQCQQEWWYYAGYAKDSGGNSYSLQFSINRFPIVDADPLLQIIACITGIGDTATNTYLLNTAYGLGVSTGPEQVMGLTIPTVSDELYDISTSPGVGTAKTRVHLTGGNAGVAGSTYQLDSSATGKVYKITNTAIVSDLANFPQQSNIIGVKAGESGAVYVAVYAENRVVKIDKNGKKTTVNVSIGLNKPADVAIGPDSTLYIADQGNRRIVKVTKTGIASILAGKTGVEGDADGTGENARFVYASNIRYGADNNIWILDADRNSHILGKSLRKISLGGVVTTFYKVAKLGIQTGIVDFAPARKDKNFDPVTRENFFLITNNVTTQGRFEYKISHLSSEKVETTIVPYREAGYQDGPADEAILSGPNGIAVTTSGIFLADGNSAIRKIARKL